MRQNTWRSALARHRTTRAGVALAGIIAAAALIAPAGASAAAADPVTVAVSYSSEVSVGPPAVFAINPDASETIQYLVKSTDTAATDSVNFTDALPTGVTLDSLPSETWTGCGINDDNNLGGSGTVAVTDAVVTPGTSCTITLSVDVASAVAGTTVTDDVSALDWTPAAGALTQPTDAASDITDAPLMVVANPTVTTSGVTNKATYKYGQLVKFNWSTVAAVGDSIDSAEAFDNAGNTLNTGAYIDTLAVGKHYVEVEVASNDGADITKTINYTVAAPKLTSVKGAKSGYATFKIALPFKGKLTSELVHDGKVVGTTKTTVSGKKTASVKVTLTTAGKKLLEKAGKKGLKLTVKASFTPSGVATGWPTAAAANGYTATTAHATSSVTIK